MRAPRSALELASSVTSRQGVAASWRRLGRAMLLHGLLRPLARQHLRSGTVPMAVMSFDLIGSTIQVHGRWEGELIDLLRDFIAVHRGLADGVFVDVGANIGTHALALAPQFERTLAFEPHPVVSQLLRINCRDSPSIEVFEMALSDRPGPAELHTSVDNQGGSSIATGSERSGADRSSHRVSCTTLDQVLADRNDRVSLVKLDIEGHEEAALRGMAGTLARWSPVVVLEQAAARFSEGSTPSIELLRQAGYDRFFVPQRNVDLGPGLWRGALAGLARCLVGTRLRLVAASTFEARDHDMILALKAE